MWPLSLRGEGGGVTHFFFSIFRFSGSDHFSVQNPISLKSKMTFQAKKLTKSCVKNQEKLYFIRFPCKNAQIQIVQIRQRQKCGEWQPTDKVNNRNSFTIEKPSDSVKQFHFSTMYALYNLHPLSCVIQQWRSSQRQRGFQRDGPSTCISD